MTNKSAPVSHHSAKPVSDDARIDAQQDLITEVQYVLEAVLKDKGITRREVAARLKKSEATISRALDGASNLRLKTIADIATALGDRFQVSSEHFEKMKDLKKVNSMYAQPATLGTLSVISTAEYMGKVLGFEQQRPFGSHPIVCTRGSAFIEANVDRSRAAPWGGVYDRRFGTGELFGVPDVIFSTRSKATAD